LIATIEISLYYLSVEATLGRKGDSIINAIRPKALGLVVTRSGTGSRTSGRY
jgi:hypothetical protein